LKKKEVCLLFPNFKPASNKKKIQKFLKIIFIIKHIKKTIIFLKKKKEKKCIKIEKK
jgi:predicted transcriptional regulator